MPKSLVKYALLVGDGMADLPFPELGGLTPLAYAQTPNMDRVAALGMVGRVATIPDGLPPGSDVANLSLLGYDPARCYSGRAPFEAASMGLRLDPQDTAIRCNLVTIVGGRMVDYSAGHIETAAACEIIRLLERDLGTSGTHFYTGVSYRHLLVIRGFPEGCKCVPPHDISDREVNPFLPQGPGSEVLLALMEAARPVLQRALANNERRQKGEKEATDIWLWGQGRAMELPKMADRYGLSGSVISAVDLVRGLGVLAGLKVRLVEGATGYLGTNYAGKIAAATGALAEEEFVFLHVEAPDETSHEGSLQKKIAAIEEFDANIVGEMLRFQGETPGLRLLVAPDHATLVSIKTHHAMPVPFAACGEGIRQDRGAFFSEEAASGTTALSGPELFDGFIKGKL